MGFRKIFPLLLVLAITLLAIPGCDGTETDIPDTTLFPYTPAPDLIDLSLSPLPKLGETAELTFIIAKVSSFSNFEDMENARAWVEFSYADIKGSYSQAKYGNPIPLDEVMVSGELSWEGNIFEEGLPELTATIQLPREGVWVITGYFFSEGLKTYQNQLEKEIRVLVTEDTAVLMNTSEFESGPFGYLSYFPYGRGSVGITPTENEPVLLELDISKLPSVGEEVLLTCRISSIIDYPDYSARVSFWKRVEEHNKSYEVPQDGILADGDLRWVGDLKKDDSVEFSATIKFPEEGDWEIKVRGDHPKFPGAITINAIIRISITSDKQYYGWEERPRQKLSWYERIWHELSCAPPPPTTTSPPTISPYDIE